MMKQTKSAKKSIALILCFPVLLSLSLTACKKDTHDLYEHTKSTEEDTEFYSIIDPIFVSDDEMISCETATIMRVEWGDTVVLPPRYKTFDDFKIVSVKIKKLYASRFYSEKDSEEHMEWLREKVKTNTGDYDDIILIQSDYEVKQGNEAIVFLEKGDIMFEKDSSPIPRLYRTSEYLTEDALDYSLDFINEYKENREKYYRKTFCTPSIFPIENGVLSIQKRHAGFDAKETVSAEKYGLTCCLLSTIEHRSDISFEDGMSVEKFEEKIADVISRVIEYFWEYSGNEKTDKETLISKYTK